MIGKKVVVTAALRELTQKGWGDACLVPKSVMLLIADELDASRKFQAPVVPVNPCVHMDDPKCCYRVRCQLGNKCVDDDLSPRTVSENWSAPCTMCTTPRACQYDGCRVDEQVEGSNALKGAIKVVVEAAKETPRLYFAPLVGMLKGLKDSTKVMEAVREEAPAWGSSTLAELNAALDGAHELSGPPHERISELIRQRDEERIVANKLRRDYEALVRLCSRSETAAAEAQVELKRIRQND